MRLPALFLAVLLTCCGALTAADDPVLATVAGVPITLSQVDAAIPLESFGIMRRQQRQFRLERLADFVGQRRYFTDQGITPDDTQVDKALAEQLAAPPPMPCGCHQYQDFADYLAQSLLTRDDARALVWIECALDLGTARAWDTAHPGAAGRAALLAGEAAPLRTQLVHLWQLTFPLPYAPDQPVGSNADRTQTPAWQAARTALERLRAGESIADVARTAPIDPSERTTGGDVGLVASDGYAISDAMRHSTRTPGLLDEPTGGYHSALVLKWSAPTDDDLYNHLRKRFLAAERQRLEDAARAAHTPELTAAGKALAGERQ